MDIQSFIALVIAIVVIYFFLKFIVSPFLRIIFGIIAFIILLYLLQRFLGFNLNQILSPFGIYLPLEQWASYFAWLVKPINYFVDQIINFFRSMWVNVPK